jgi:hypothetical protein
MLYLSPILCIAWTMPCVDLIVTLSTQQRLRFVCMLICLCNLSVATTPAEEEEARVWDLPPYASNAVRLAYKLLSIDWPNIILPQQ